MGDREKASLRLQLNPQIRLELHGATITWLACFESTGISDNYGVVRGK